MNAKELADLIQSGKRPIIEITEETMNYIEDSFDPLMLGRVVGATMEADNQVRFLVDMNEFEVHNRRVAVPNWKDKNGEPRLTWFETIYYPKDGKEELHLPASKELPVHILEENSLMVEYAESDLSVSYVEWLEQEVQRLRYGSF